ncbi:MAG: indole-3-glycerol phosphate synthase TrpC [Candidatus Omnitrophica bacterium]|nr:indole-3-glycerol phosphate synthase TrpC [Candidatus Omnitrophota bacterium]
MKDALKSIIARKKEKIALNKQALSQEELINRISALPPAKPFIESIAKPKQISLIAEIKKASPSAGLIRQDFDPLKIASIYQEAQVQAISVLTEEDFFQGSLNDLNQVRQTISLPLLRKDFILEPYQVYEARAYGADAILLIADILTRETITELSELAQSLGLDALIEVHDEKELKKILKLKNLPLIGINNRSLNTFEVDFTTTQKLFPLIPKDKTVVVESGIKSYQDVLFLRILGVSAVLIGEAFMRADNIYNKVEEIMGW